MQLMSNKARNIHYLRHDATWSYVFEIQGIIKFKLIRAFDEVHEKKDQVMEWQFSFSSEVLSVSLRIIKSQLYNHLFYK